MSWKRIAEKNRNDYGKRFATDAFEIENTGCLIQTTVERVEPGGTAVGISTVLVLGVKVVEVEPGKFKLQSRWPLDDEFSEAAIGSTGVGLSPVTEVELTGDALPPTEDVSAVEAAPVVEVAPVEAAPVAEAAPVEAPAEPVAEAVKPASRKSARNS